MNWLIEQNDLDQAERWLQEFKPAESIPEPRLLELKSRLLKAGSATPSLLALLTAVFGGATPIRSARSSHCSSDTVISKEAEQAYRAFVAQEAKEPARFSFCRVLVPATPGAGGLGPV